MSLRELHQKIQEEIAASLRGEGSVMVLDDDDYEERIKEIFATLPSDQHQEGDLELALRSEGITFHRVEGAIEVGVSLVRDIWPEKRKRRIIAHELLEQKDTELRKNRMVQRLTSNLLIEGHSGPEPILAELLAYEDLGWLAQDPMRLGVFLREMANDVSPFSERKLRKNIAQRVLDRAYIEGMIERKVSVGIVTDVLDFLGGLGL